MTDAIESTIEAPVACLLSEPQRAARGDRLGRELFARAERVADLGDGYASRFPAAEAWGDTLLGFVAAERRCRPFLAVDLAFAPHGGPVWVRRRGSADAKRFVRETYTPLAEATVAARP